MDDFGTQYSNLSVLLQYDFDSAKIDRSMVTEITTNEKSRMMLDYTTSLINDLGIECIVEGIETKEQVDILRYKTGMLADTHKAPHPTRGSG